MRRRSVVALLLGGLALLSSSFLVGQPLTAGEALAAPAWLPANFASIKKTAAQTRSWPQGVVDYTVVVSLGSARTNVTVDDTFLYGADYVSGTARMNDSPTSDPTPISKVPNRVAYRFSFASLPQGTTTLTYQGRVDPKKQCRGQKVRNEARLSIGGRWAAQSMVDTKIQCGPPVEFGVTAAGPGTDNAQFMGSALTLLGAGSWFSYGSDAAEAPGRVELVRPGANLTQLAARAKAKRGTAWLIGNEPNVPGQDNLTPQAYGDFLRNVANAIKKADWSAVLVGPNVLNWNRTCAGCAGGYTEGDDWSAAFVSYYRTKYGRVPLDAWGMHAYTLDWGQLPMIDPADDQAQMVAARQWLDSSGLRLPIWLTEFGVIWAYPGAVQDPGTHLYHPVGEYQASSVIGYIDGMLGWLTGPKGSAAKVKRWFLYATLPPPEPYASVVGGISLLQPGSPPVLSPYGTRYLDWATGAAP